MTDTQDSNQLLAERLKQRAEYGANKYGTRLKPWDGRNTVVDAIEEALDLAVYLTKLHQEREDMSNELLSLAIQIDMRTDWTEEGSLFSMLCDVETRLREISARLSADIPRIGSKSEAEIERETWAAVKGPSERLADMSTPL